MRYRTFNTNRRTAAATFLAAIFGAGLGTAAVSGDEAGSPAATTPQKQDKVVVEPYKTRPAPSHRVSLHDDRVFFLKKLEETGDGFVLHTMEDEVIEVERSEVTEIVEFETD